MAEKAPSKKVQDFALDRVEEERTFIRTLTSNMRNDWLRWYRIVRRFRLDVTATQNRVFLPLGWEQVESIAPRITAHNPIYQLTPTKNSSIPFTELVGEWLTFMWEENNLRRQARLMVKNGLTYGTGFVKLDMEQVTRKEIVERTAKGTETIIMPDPVTGEPEEEEVEIEEIVEEEIELSNLPIFRVIDIFDIDIDPRVESIKDARAIIHTVEGASFVDLKTDEEALNYFNLDKIKDIGQSLLAPDANSKEQKLTVRNIPSQKGSSDSSSDDAGGVDLNALTIREYWGSFSPEDDSGKEEEYVITTVNDELVIRVDRNPYKTDTNPDGIRPFELYVDHDVPNELYGVGEIEPTETMQIGINKIRNQRLDNVDLVMNRMWIFDRNTGINPRDLKSFPGNIIPADDISGLQPLTTPDVTASSYAEEDRYLRDFQLATGTITSTGGGGRDDFTNTATGQKIRSKEQNSRYQLKIENLEDTLSRIGKKMLQMIHALDDESFVIRRRKEDGSPLFTEVQKGVLDKAIEGMNVKVKAGSTFSDDNEEQSNMALTRWNLAQGAVKAGVLDAAQLAEIWEEVDRLVFGGSIKGKRPSAGGVEGMRAKIEGQPPPPQPGQVPGGAPPEVGPQINPQTGVPNGLAPGMAL